METKQKTMEILKTRICEECGLEPDDYSKVISILREELETKKWENTKIQTKNKAEDWVDCDHKNWTEIKADGWEFAFPDFENKVMYLMRNGYINEFREVKK